MRYLLLAVAAARAEVNQLSRLAHRDGPRAPSRSCAQRITKTKAPKHAGLLSPHHANAETISSHLNIASVAQLPARAPLLHRSSFLAPFVALIPATEARATMRGVRGEAHFTIGRLRVWRPAVLVDPAAVPLNVLACSALPFGVLGPAICPCSRHDWPGYQNHLAESES